MTVTYDLLVAEVRRVSVRESVIEPTAAMQVMTVGVMAMAREVPASLRGALVDAGTRWLTDRSSPSLEAARVAAWQFLDAKNGSSVPVADREDMAVRALICVLWDEPDPGGDLEMSLDFYAGIAQRFGGLESALGG